MTVETSSHLKQVFRHLFLDYLLKDDTDANYRLYRLIQHLKAHKKINTLKQDLGESYDTVLRMSEYYLPKYLEAQQYRDIIKNSPDKKVREEYDEKLRKLCIELPVIDVANIIIFEALLKNCDLKDNPIPHPSIKDSRDNTAPFQDSSYYSE